MRTADLLQVRSAFEADKADAERPETVTFCDGRLALIADVLSERIDETEVCA